MLERLIGQLLRQIGLQLADGNTHLLHAVPLPDGDALVAGILPVAHGVEVHGDAEGRADLILPAIL